MLWKRRLAACLWQILLCPKALWFTCRSLSYNTFTNSETIADSAFEPVFWMVDNYTGVLGPAFVVLVLVLTGAVVFIYWTTLYPLIIANYSSFWITFHMIFGHWLLINILFNYIMVAFTSPGSTPQGERVKYFENFDICKKCVQPKPPRTHHCSICKRCVLKMDHHCPWVNNCIGHFNQRYFLLFCVYMTMGTIYVTYVSYDLFNYHFWHTGGASSLEYSQAVALVGSRLPIKFNVTNLMKQYTISRNDPYYGNDTSKPSPLYVHNTVTFEFILCTAVTIALGLLTLWHIRLVWKGETSIEVHINKKKAKELKQKGRTFKNPYDFGFVQNFRMMLGLVHGRTMLRILFPSVHLPYGDGISWPAPPVEESASSFKGSEKVHEV